MRFAPKRADFLSELKWISAAIIVLAVATIITYYPSLTYDFQFDDI